MSDNVEPLLAWLKRKRRANVVELGLLDHHFDLDGALAAGQPELAWRTREVMLISGVELYLCHCGLSPAAGTDHADRARTLLRDLAAVDRQLAEEAWQLLLRAAPADGGAMRAEISAVEDFLLSRLSVGSAASRAAGIRAWADGARLVRDVGRLLGVAGSDSWYLPEAPDLGEQVRWYDEVISLAAQQT